jgi:hypothetical protein
MVPAQITSRFIGTSRRTRESDSATTDPYLVRRRREAVLDDLIGETADQLLQVIEPP